MMLHSLPEHEDPLTTLVNAALLPELAADLAASSSACSPRSTSPVVMGGSSFYSVNDSVDRKSMDNHNLQSADLQTMQSMQQSVQIMQSMAMPTLEKDEQSATSDFPSSVSTPVSGLHGHHDHNRQCKTTSSSSASSPSCEEKAYHQIRAHGMDLYSSLTALYRVLAPHDPTGSLNAASVTAMDPPSQKVLAENKGTLLKMFRTNPRNVDMLSVSFADLARCFKDGLTSPQEDLSCKEAMCEEFVHINSRAGGSAIVEAARELANCQSNGFLGGEELSSWILRLYSNADSNFSASSQQPAFLAYDQGNGYNGYFGAQQGSSNYSAGSISSAHNNNTTSNNSEAYSYTGSESNSSQSVSSSGTANSANAGVGKKKKKSSTAAKRTKSLNQHDEALLQSQIERLVMVMPEVIPDQTHPPMHGRGFGASARPFNYDNAHTANLPNDRINWRCHWCFCSGRFTPALRKGPTGPKTLCNSCGMWWARRGILPEERWREFMNPRGLAGARADQAAAAAMAAKTQSQSRYSISEAFEDFADDVLGK